jgi:carbon monoxide dehydrogenase subunit G
MQFENTFTVPLPPDDAWRVLMDVERITPCMPGAELTEVIDKTNFKGRISVRLGPVALTFAGTVKLEDVDDVGHTAKIKGQGSDSKGRGGAQAAAAFRLEPVPEGTKVIVKTDLTLSGAVAQYGRGVGIIQATANQIIQQFAANLKSELTTPAATPASAAATSARPDMNSAASAAATTAKAPPGAMPRPAAKPISGFTLMWNVLLESIRNLFRGKQS